MSSAQTATATADVVRLRSWIGTEQLFINVKPQIVNLVGYIVLWANFNFPLLISTKLPFKYSAVCVLAGGGGFIGVGWVTHQDDTGCMHYWWVHSRPKSYLFHVKKQLISPVFSQRHITALHIGGEEGSTNKGQCAGWKLTRPEVFLSPEEDVNSCTQKAN